jgi:hypothetical protein
LPIEDRGTARTRVVHGIGIAAFIIRDADGFLFRRTYRSNAR